MENIIIKNEDELTIKDGQRAFVFDFVKKEESRLSLKIKIGNDCVVEYVAIFKHNRNTEIEMGDNSQLNMNSLYLGEGRFQIITKLNNNCFVNNQVLLTSKHEEVMEVKDSYVFQGQGSYGRFRVKALADDKAVINYFSDVAIRREAIFSDARIDMNMALLSREAKGVMLPGLKVETSKVKAGHGASTFQLSPEDLFYLNSRGIDMSEAKSLIVSSAVNEFTRNIKDEKARSLILELLAV